MERDKLYFVLYEQQKEFARDFQYIPREITPQVLSFLRLKLPLIITGMRRVGKSTLLKIVRRELCLDEKKYLYINFNDERLTLFTPEDFQKINDFMVEQDYQEKSYLFLDEVQEVEKWEKWVDRLKEKHPIIITGSNSKLLSKEISTVLTGRSINLSLWPFSFREFLHSKSVDPASVKLDLKVQSQVRKEFTAFLQQGGIPKAVLEEEEKILTDLYENIIYRDIIKRFNPNLEKPIKEIALYLITNASKEISLRSVSQAVGIKNLSTLKSILNTLEKAFLFYFIPKFDFSLRKQLQNPRKAYCIDNGFITTVGFRFSGDQGRLLENTVLIELKRKEQETYYFTGKRECDFITREKNKITLAAQVTWELNEGNQERELQGLLDALKYCRLNRGYIITFDQEEEIEMEGKKINIIPAWKWLLKNEFKVKNQ